MPHVEIDKQSKASWTVSKSLAASLQAKFCLKVSLSGPWLWLEDQSKGKIYGSATTSLSSAPFCSKLFLFLFYVSLFIFLMAHLDFYNNELKTCIDSTLMESIHGRRLRISFLENIAVTNLTHGITPQPQPLRNPLEICNYLFGRGTENACQKDLFSIESNVKLECSLHV